MLANEFSQEKASEIGELIRSARGNAGLTQDELGSRTFMCRSVISRAETGARDLKWREIKQLFLALEKEIVLQLKEISHER